MPYIDRKSRQALDKEIESLLAKLKSRPPDKRDGHLNYCLCRLLQSLYPPSYFNYNRMMGVLSCVREELYRRLVAPYEDKKIKENGDVF